MIQPFVVFGTCLLLLLSCQPKGEAIAPISALNQPNPGPAHVEAAESLVELYRSATYYYRAPRVARGTGMRVDCQFPATQDWTPKGNPCDQEDNKFKVDVSLWNTPTWSALNFQQTDNHYAAYKFEASGTIREARGVIRARFDSDCDGRWEEMSVPLQPLGVDLTQADCEISRKPPNASELERLVAQSREPETPPVPEIRPQDRSPRYEVIDEIHRLFKGAVDFLTSPRIDANTGTRIPCHFPESTDWTPAGRPCGNPGDQFPAQPAVWEHPTWQALGFQLNHPHHGSYRVISKGSLADAQIEIQGRIDADCDGTFEVYSKPLEAAVYSSLMECSPRTPFASLQTPRVPYDVDRLKRTLPRDPQHRLSAAKVEAIDFLGVIRARSIALFTNTPHTGSDIRRTCRFPASTDWTPAGSPCGDGVPLFRPQPEAWHHPSWRALRFERLDPHFVSYRIESQGTNENATLIVHTRSDANCDGQWETGSTIIKGTYDPAINFCGITIEKVH